MESPIVRFPSWAAYETLVLLRPAQSGDHRNDSQTLARVF